jgi:hypothetical protein
MIKIGIIGINEGNGHPYSYSSIFNGFNQELIDLCPMQIIKKYLIEIHKNENIIADVNVTHIWTQDFQESSNIAKLTNIKHVVKDIDDLINKVDAVILARDDIENHYKFAKQIVKRGVPLFIDKLITDDFESLNNLLAMKNNSNCKIMATSSSRYTPLIYEAKEKLNNSDVKYLHGISKVSWLRYANHLLDGICFLFGTDFYSIQNISTNGQIDIMHIVYKNGLECILTIKADFPLPISFTVYSNNEHLEVLFTDKSLTSYFFGFYNMLSDFTNFIKSGTASFSFNESIKISSLIIMGEQSKKQNNRKILFDELYKTPIKNYL